MVYVWREHEQLSEQVNPFLFRKNKKQCLITLKSQNCLHKSTIKLIKEGEKVINKNKLQFEFPLLLIHTLIQAMARYIQSTVYEFTLVNVTERILMQNFCHVEEVTNIVTVQFLIFISYMKQNSDLKWCALYYRRQPDF